MISSCSTALRGSQLCYAGSLFNNCHVKLSSKYPLIFFLHTIILSISVKCPIQWGCDTNASLHHNVFCLHLIAVGTKVVFALECWKCPYEVLVVGPVVWLRICRPAEEKGYRSCQRGGTASRCARQAIRGEFGSKWIAGGTISMDNCNYSSI